MVIMTFEQGEFPQALNKLARVVPINNKENYKTDVSKYWRYH